MGRLWPTSPVHHCTWPRGGARAGLIQVSGSAELTILIDDVHAYVTACMFVCVYAFMHLCTHLRMHICRLDGPGQQYSVCLSISVRTYERCRVAGIQTCDMSACLLSFFFKKFFAPPPLLFSFLSSARLHGWMHVGLVSC